jgi:transposase, IS5 family
MDQITFSDLEYQHKKRKTRREKFLERMELLVPWEQLEKKIRRHYPKAGRGRHPYPLTVMLRIHCVQLFYNVSDPAMEDMLYEIDSVRRFVGLKITGPIPDESTILRFRHLLESHDLGTKLFEVINQHLADQGLMLKEGTILDASIIAAPSSTKNQTSTRDPEMHEEG